MNKNIRGQESRRKQNTKKRIGILIGILLALIIAGSIVFIVSFHVEQVEVVGNTRSTNQEVKAAVLKGPLATNSLWCSLVIKKVENPNVPFTASIEVERVSSHKIRLHVNEKQMVGYVKYLDCYFYFDKNGTVVESQVISAGTSVKTGMSDEVEISDESGKSEDEGSVTYHSAVTEIPYVTGLSFDRVVLNEKLPIERETVFNTVQGITRIVDKYQIPPEEVEFDEEYRITLHYGKIQVMIGADTLLEEKIIRAAAILPKLEGKAGVLHLEDYTADTTNIVFSESEPEDSTDTASDDEDSSKKEDSEEDDSDNEEDSEDEDNSDDEDYSDDEDTYSDDTKDYDDDTYYDDEDYYDEEDSY